MRTVRINFRTTNRDLKIENPTNIALDSTFRAVSILVEKGRESVKYMIPIDNSNFIEDTTAVNLVQPSGATILPEVN